MSASDTYFLNVQSHSNPQADSAEHKEQSMSLSSNSESEQYESGELHSTEVDAKSLDWDDRFDPANPHNWPLWKKWCTAMIAALLCLAVTMGSSLYMGAVPALVKEYGVNQTLACAGLTFYLLGLSTVVGAPLSEVFGRKPVYVISLPISLLFSLGVGLSNGRMSVILPMRLFSGIFASPALSVASGTIVDIFDVDEVSVAMSLFCMAPFLGPVISPIMGGYAAENGGWRWVVWIRLISGGLLMPMLILMPETHKYVILAKRARKRGVNLRKSRPGETRAFIKRTLTETLFRPVKMLVVEPIVFVFSVYVAFVFAVLFAFFEAYPTIFRGVYHFGMGETGLTFIGISIGLWLGMILYVWYDRKYFFPAPPPGTPLLANPQSIRDRPMRGQRDPETGQLVPLVPEMFLTVTKFGSLALPVALFWLGWSARPSVHWIVPALAGIPFGFGMILIFFSVLMYFTTTYPVLVVSSAFAANNLLRYVLACVFPLFTIQMYDNLGVGWASSVFGFISLALVPVPWIFERYGKAMRHRSVFGYNAMAAARQREEDPTEDQLKMERISSSEQRNKDSKADSQS
ncbi:AaceriAER339Cp [[Ashbya] aceris (nom. inval.)]|nr:AaceriAER339Cp [[Ashbya] aceris (nom. inval.)]